MRVEKMVTKGKMLIDLSSKVISTPFKVMTINNDNNNNNNNNLLTLGSIYSTIIYNACGATLPPIELRSVWRIFIMILGLKG